MPSISLGDWTPPCEAEELPWFDDVDPYDREVDDIVRGEEYARREEEDERSVRSDYHHCPEDDARASSVVSETEQERRARWAARWEREGATQPPRPSFERPAEVPCLGLLLIEYWDRSEEDKNRKQDHLEELDAQGSTNREDHVLSTTLKDVHVAIEPNMFPYLTPPGVLHYTLWSRTYLELAEVEVFIESWLYANLPGVTAWGFDTSNLAEGMSVDLWHVHVFLYQPLHPDELPPVAVIHGDGISHHVSSPPSPHGSPVLSASSRSQSERRDWYYDDYEEDCGKEDFRKEDERLSMNPAADEACQEAPRAVSCENEPVAA